MVACSKCEAAAATEGSEAAQGEKERDGGSFVRWGKEEEKRGRTSLLLGRRLLAGVTYVVFAAKAELYHRRVTRGGGIFP